MFKYIKVYYFFSLSKTDDEAHHHEVETTPGVDRAPLYESYLITRVV